MLAARPPQSACGSPPHCDGIALRARPGGAAEQERPALRVAARRLVHAAVVEQRVDVVQRVALRAVGGHHVRLDLLAEVRLDHVHAEFEQLAVAIAPVGVGLRVREVEQARLGQRRQHRAEGLEVPLVAIGLAGARILEQPALRREFVEQRVAHRDQRVFPDADAEIERLELLDHRSRIRIARRIPLEGEARVGVLPGAAVERDGVAGHAALAHLARDREDLLRRAVVGLREDQPEAPQRRHGRAPGQRRVLAEDLRTARPVEQEQVERRRRPP